MAKDLVYDQRTGEVLDRPEWDPQQNAIALVSRSEIDNQVSTAKRYPRSIDAFIKQAITLATLDEETSARCFYSVPRAGKVVSGPSVHLAKIVASCWGHMRTETRVIGEDEKYVTVQSTAWDVQHNVLNRQEVRRRITDKNGKRYSDDMVSTTAAAASSIAYRNAVLSVIPDVYVRRIEAEARRVAVGDQKTLTERRGVAMDYWRKFGITHERVLAALGKKAINDVDLDDLVTLKGLANAVKDGTLTIDAAFPPPAAELKEGKGFGFGKNSKTGGDNQATHKQPRDQDKQAVAPASEGGTTRIMLLTQIQEADNAGDLIALSHDLKNFTEQDLAPTDREAVLTAVEAKLHTLARGEENDGRD